MNEAQVTKESTTLGLIFEFLSRVKSQSYQVKVLGRGIKGSLTGQSDEQAEEKEKIAEEPEAILEKIYQGLLQVNSNLSRGIEHLNDVSKDLGVK